MARLFNGAKRIWAHCRNVSKMSKSKNMDVIEKAGVKAFHVSLTIEYLISRIVEASRYIMDKEFEKGMLRFVPFFCNNTSENIVT